jgi:hypothetical protein
MFTMGTYDVVDEKEIMIDSAHLWNRIPVPHEAELWTPESYKG